MLSEMHYYHLFAVYNRFIMNARFKRYNKSVYRVGELFYFEYQYQINHKLIHINYERLSNF